jgi:hypothetical protein
LAGCEEIGIGLLFLVPLGHREGNLSPLKEAQCALKDVKSV